MRCSLVDYRISAISVLVGATLALSGCQSGGGLNAEANNQQASAPGEENSDLVRESDLRAFCPSVGLREGTAYFQTYQKGGQGDASKIVYQASISDVTRTCRSGDGSIAMTVAVAGKIVPGPVGRTGAITMPIRVAVVRGSEVLYSQLYKHNVTVGDTSGATQFVFKDENIVIPGTVDRNVQVFVGYDEGPTGGS